MKEKMKGFIAGVIVTAITLTGIAVFSTAREQTLTAMFDNIQIFLSGNYLELTDANDNPVEPFIVDGTTYLPVRAISEALGLNVYWDEETNSIYLDYYDGYEWDGWQEDDYFSFFEIFEWAGTDKTVGYVKTGSTIPGDYTELLFDRITRGNFDEYSYVGISVNMVSPQRPENERGDAQLIEQWFSDVDENRVRYLYYSDPSSAGDGVPPDGFLVITLMDNCNIYVEQYGDIGIEEGISLEGEYEFQGVG